MNAVQGVKHGARRCRSKEEPQVEWGGSSGDRTGGKHIDERIGHEGAKQERQEGQCQDGE